MILDGPLRAIQRMLCKRKSAVLPYMPTCGGDARARIFHADHRRFGASLRRRGDLDYLWENFINLLALYSWSISISLSLLWAQFLKKRGEAETRRPVSATGLH